MKTTNKTIVISATLATILATVSIFAGMPTQISYAAFPVIDFDGLSDGTSVTNQFESQGAYFSSTGGSALVFEDIAEATSLNNILIGNNGNGVLLEDVQQPITIDVVDALGTPAVTDQISFELISVGQAVVTVTAENSNGNTVYSQDIGPNYPGFGACNGLGNFDSISISGVGPISSVVIEITTPAIDCNDGIGIDDVVIGDLVFYKSNNCAGTVFTQKDTATQECSFTIYPGTVNENDSINDTIPAEWDVVNTSNDNCIVESSNKKDNGKSSTKLWCPADEGSITVEVTTRESPGKGHTKNDGDPVFKPTFCGILSLNDGAQLVDENGIILATTDPLTLLVSEDGDGSNDCDQDGLTDLQEFTGSENNEFNNEPTDPANPDSDGDGLSDYDEINTYASNPNDPNTVILDTSLAGSPGGSPNEFGEHLGTFTSYGDGASCPDFSGTVFLLDNGYIHVSATGLLRSTDCIVPTPTHDNVQATLHCDEGDIGPTGTEPLSTAGGASTEGDFELTDSLGTIGSCTNATVYVESGPPDGNGKWLAKGQ